MELQSIADVQKLQAAFVKSLNTTAERLLGDNKLGPKVLLDDKRQLLADLKDRLRAATDARAEAVRAYDREIAQRESAIASLEAELKNDERVIGRISRATGRKALTKSAGAGRKKRAK